MASPSLQLPNWKRSGRANRLLFVPLVCVIVAGAAGWPNPAVAANPAALGPAARNASPRQLESVRKEFRQAEQQHAARMDAIGRKFADMGLKAEAEHSREVASPMEATLFRIKKLPKSIQNEIPAGIAEQEADVRREERKVQEEYAAQLYVFSRKALKAGYPSFAYQLVQEVARQDPDHSAARRLLGYKLRGKDWVTPYAARMLDEGNVWDEKFGWLKRAQLAEYRAGRRYYRGAWKSADQEAELRRDFRNAWQIRTDHYLVKTNHSLERGVEIAKSLEQYHDFFMQTFASFFSTPEQMRNLFQTTGPNSNIQVRRDPYVVHYFRTRDEYVRRLIAKVPQIEMTNGLYYTADRVAYFYFDPEQPNPDTVFHEATHQLFYESQKVDRMIAMTSNFWVVEGIACYMESYHCDAGQCVVGDPAQPRIVAARHRCVVDKYYIPLERFAAMGMHEFQGSLELKKNYSQAAGLAHFFMHYDGGRYRDALVEHLSDIYREAPRQRSYVRSLAELTGVPFAELDSQYAAYMQSLP